MSPFVAEGGIAPLSITYKCGGPGGEARSSAQNAASVARYAISRRDGRIMGRDALAGVSAVHRVLHLVQCHSLVTTWGELRAHGCCYSIPTSAAISPFGARSSDGYLTSDAICPPALRAFLKMNRIDHGVHSLLPLVGGSTGASLCRQCRLDSVLAITTIWEASPTITRVVQPRKKRSSQVELGWQGLLDNPPCEDD